MPQTSYGIAQPEDLPRLREIFLRCFGAAAAKEADYIFSQKEQIDFWAAKVQNWAFIRIKWKIIWQNIWFLRNAAIKLVFVGQRLLTEKDAARNSVEIRWNFQLFLIHRMRWKMQCILMNCRRYTIQWYV